MQHAPFSLKKREGNKHTKLIHFNYIFIFHTVLYTVQVRRNFNGGNRGIKTSIMFPLLRLIANEEHLVYEACFNEQQQWNVRFFGT